MTALVTGLSKGKSLPGWRLNALSFQDKAPHAGGQDGGHLVEALGGGHGGRGESGDHGGGLLIGEPRVGAYTDRIPRHPAKCFTASFRCR